MEAYEPYVIKSDGNAYFRASSLCRKLQQGCYPVWQPHLSVLEVVTAITEMLYLIAEAEYRRYANESYGNIPDNKLMEGVLSKDIWLSAAIFQKHHFERTISFAENLRYSLGESVGFSSIDGKPIYQVF